MMTLDDYTLISEDDFVSKYMSLCEGEADTYGIDAVLRVYKGDLTIDGDFDLDKELQRAGDHFGMVVEGNLTVGGVLFQDEYMVGGNFLFVLGDLKAYSVNKGAGAFFVQGDLIAEDTLFALPYDEGYLEVQGSVSAKQICMFESCSRWAPDLKVKAGKVLCSERLPVDFTYDHHEDILVTDSMEGLRTLVNERKPLLKDGVS